ncbi:MAG TPA: pitrilysin family protein [Kouleothrix sp.]|uniref:M16 family metallopeptidase n=1 Tax=Kouleothrix sp. TaxID=2779161 RepID=UPI002B8F4E23|nr:pitrilysin family protein [Kouleothrix sp.]
MLQTFTMPGGLRVLVDELPHTHSVSVGCFVGVGSGHENPPSCGISHFIEHMLFKGSRRHPTPRLISDAIEGIGGILDAYTSFESTVYYAKVADIHFDRAVDVLSDMLLQPCFDPRDVEKERRVIAEELRQTEDTPSELVHLLLDGAMWGDQPLGRDIAGDEASVAAFAHEQVVAHWARHYNRANTVISIAGNIAAERAAMAIAQAFDPMPYGEPALFVPSVPPQPGPALALRTDDSEQGNFCIGFPGIAQNDRDRRAMQVFDTVLGGGMSSRLFQEIREELGLAYSVGSYSREHHDAGKWVIYGSVEPDNLAPCLETTMRELRGALNDGITDDELRRVKEQVKGGILLSLEDTWSVASRNGSHQLRYGRVIPVDQVVAEVEQVMRDDVLRVAQRVLRQDALHLAVIGPYDDGDELRALLTLA